MKKLTILLGLALLSFSNIAVAEIKSLECRADGNDPWKAVRTLTFDLSKEEAEWKTIKTYYRGRAKGTSTTNIFAVKLTVLPRYLRFTIDSKTFIDVSRKDLSYVHSWDASLWDDTPMLRSQTGTCKLVEIEDIEDNIL